MNSNIYNQVVSQFTTLMNNRKMTNFSFSANNNKNFIVLTYNNQNYDILVASNFNKFNWTIYKTTLLNTIHQNTQNTQNTTQLAQPLSTIQSKSQTSTYTRPVLFGVSCGNGSDLLRSSNSCCSAGTLGFLVVNNNIKYLVTNAHVLINYDPRVVNNSRFNTRIGDIITQPGGYDSECNSSLINSNKIATLSKWTAIYPGARPLVDLAIAQIDVNKINTQGQILNIGFAKEATALNTKLATINLQVRKSGRTTGLTSSRITYKNAAISVSYSSCYGRNFNVTYYNCFFIDNSNTFSAAGDSGSLIVDTMTPANAIGLLFAGNSSIVAGFTIKDVLSNIDSLLTSRVGTTKIVGQSNIRDVQEENKEIENKEVVEVEVNKRNKSIEELGLSHVNNLSGYGYAEDDEGEYIAVLVHGEINRDVNNITNMPRELDGKRVKVIHIGNDPVRAF